MAETEEVAAPVEVEPVVDVEDVFSIEEKEAMKTLAEMGRLFDDEDEARMD